MMGVRTPEICWAVNKRQVINWGDYCIYLVDLFELCDDARTYKLSIDVHGFSAPRSGPLTWCWVLDTHWMGCCFDIRYILGVLMNRNFSTTHVFAYRLSALVRSPNSVEKL
jgi:hypothetical protein